MYVCKQQGRVKLCFGGGVDVWVIGEEGFFFGVAKKKSHTALYMYARDHSFPVARRQSVRDRQKPDRPNPFIEKTERSAGVE